MKEHIEIFLDNFRGFSQTFIPIKDVSFFVGENSTGKSSVLGIYKILLSSEFWNTGELRARDFSFGHFDDMVSITSTNKSAFSLGIISYRQKRNENIENDAIFLRFIEKDGLPKLNLLLIIANNCELLIKFDGNKIKHSIVEQKSKNESMDDFRTSAYNKWNNSLSDEVAISDGLKSSDIIGPADRSIPLRVIMLFLLDDFQRTKDTKKRINFYHISINRFQRNRSIAWIAPIRTKPRRTYDDYMLDFSPEGDHTPYLIKKILGEDSKACEFKNYISNFGSESGLFSGIKIKKYGKNVTDPFEVDIVLEKKALSINNVGYGVSQSLPVIVELFNRPKNTIFLIQQPEVHLHPKAQAALGDIFYRLAVDENKKFLIETHSDYTIDSFRLSCKRNSDIVESQVLFFERGKKGNVVHVLPLDSNGDLPEDQPTQYREFFINHEIKLLGD
ncbi:MAG: AAA family ATPase [Thermodesulfobacteriota bacterium]